MILLVLLHACTTVVFQWQVGQANANLSGAPNSLSKGARASVWTAFAFWWFGVTYGQESFAGVAQKGAERQLISASVESLLQQEISYYDQEILSAGMLTASLAKHTTSIAETSTISLTRVRVALATIGTLLMSMVLSAKFGAMVFPFILIAGAAGWLQVRALQHVEKLHQASQDAASTIINEAVDAIATIAILGQERETVHAISMCKSDAKHLRMWQNTNHAAQAVGECIAFAVGALLHWWGARLYVRGDISPVALFAVYEGAFGVIFVISPVLHYLNAVTRALHGWTILKSYLQREPQYAQKDLSQKQSASVHEAMHGDIIISMEYPTRKTHLALDGLNLRLRGGQVNAITGTSGGGKSTILALLQRFYDPTEGCLTFGGLDSQAIPLGLLQSHLAIVSQNSVLFEGDIRFNLSVGTVIPALCVWAELEHVCRQACILDFIQSLPDGFATDIGLKGTRLSGGQRQRLCIARALLRNPSVLLLDEATSSLDAANEAEVERALQNASKGRTVVVVAHKLQSIRNADHIFVIAEGKLVEQGTHDDLVEKQALYYDLIKSQL
ncbi:hypothetical protein FFLO_06337 [Filobasidium floriforme]|uniref:Uncharacterized protein n=1 Tax=Filobasidium floriforme TaxID=5210 RepID=A0A8K0NMY5_9TREE|nr:hypothetical protein FFLO_06337 [Filobasidium floriforme]